MRTLITGGTGFIGRHLVEALQKEKRGLRLLVRDEKKTEGLDVDFVKGDLDHMKKEMLDGVDVVYHLAAVISTSTTSKKTMDLMRKVNVDGTRKVLELCLKSDIKKFVHFGSIASMGDPPEMADETAECRPVTAYGKSKYESERIAFSFLKNHGIPVTIVRPATVYGPGELSNIYVLIRAMDRGIFRIIGNGKNLMPLAYVKNVVQGAVLAEKSKKSVGETYILADKRAYTVNEIADTICRNLGRKPPGHIPPWLAKILAVSFEGLGRLTGMTPPLSRKRLRTLTTNKSYSIEKGRSELGYDPKVSLEEGMKKMVEWYKESK